MGKAGLIENKIWKAENKERTIMMICCKKIEARGIEESWMACTSKAGRVSVTGM